MVTIYDAVSLVTGLLIAFISFLAWICIGKDGYLSVDLAKTLFPTLIQINATLIGFWGIIFVYNLRTLFETRNIFVNFGIKMNEKIQLLKFKMENSLDKNFKIQKKKRIDFLEKRKKRLLKGMDDLDSTKQNFRFFGIFIICCFLTSIFMSIIAIGRITDIGIETYWVPFSVAPFFFGIATLFISIGISRRRIVTNPEN